MSFLLFLTFDFVIAPISMSLNDLSSAQQLAVRIRIKYVETYEFAGFTNIAHYRNVNKNENIISILFTCLDNILYSFI